MRERSFEADTKDQPFDEIILQQGELISDRLNMLRQEQYPPDAQKGLRQFSLAEVAYYLGVTLRDARFNPVESFPQNLVFSDVGQQVPFQGRRSYPSQPSQEATTARPRVRPAIISAISSSGVATLTKGTAVSALD